LRIAALFAGCLSWAATASASSDAEFQRLLASPDDPVLNRQFAVSAEARGELRHALAALERALDADPNNPDIRAEYNRVRLKLLPAATAVTLQMGGTYSSNPRQVNGSSPSKEEDGIVDGAASVEDERTIAGVRIRSLAYAAGQWNFETSELSTGRVAAESGPVVMLSTETWLQVAPGVAIEWLDGMRLYTEASAALTLGTVVGGLTQTVTARLGWRDGGDNELQYANSKTFEVLGRFVASPSLIGGDYVYLQPRFRVSNPNDEGAGEETIFDDGPTTIGPLTLVTQDLSPYDYREWGGRISYFFPLADRQVYLGFGISVFQRNFDTSVLDPDWLALGSPIGTDEKRRDLYVEPTAHLIFPNLIGPNIDLRADYRFEDNFSNDDYRDFINHVAGVRVIGRF
jgi:hypothetical protein